MHLLKKILLHKKKEILSVIPDTVLQVVVVNYESAWRIQDALEEFGAELIIADEGHKIKEDNGHTINARRILPN